MGDPRVEKLAKVLVEYSLEVKPNDRVAIFGTTWAEPLLLASYREVLHAGGHPQLIPQIPEWEYILYTEASDDQIQFISPLTELVYNEYECFIALESAANTRKLTNVDPARQSLRGKAYMPIMETYMKRSASRDLRWVLAMFPTEAYAQDAEMSLLEFEDFVYSTCYADTEAPIVAWREIRESQRRFVDWLAGKKDIVVKGPNVDLTLSIEGRAFDSADGRVNMPDGEIFTSPVEDSANGWIRFTFPAITRGREVEGIELYFEAGRVVKATAKKNEKFLQTMLNVDEGARYLGEFAIGTNHRINRFIKNILFDEKIGGTIHVAVGFGMEEVGGNNKSAIHWDMICDMRDGGQIFVDNELFYEAGEFKI